MMSIIVSTRLVVRHALRAVACGNKAVQVIAPRQLEEDFGFFARGFRTKVRQRVDQSRELLEVTARICSDNLIRCAIVCTGTDRRE